MDQYLAGLPADQRAALEQLRATIAELAPDAEEGMSYGVPGYRVGGKTIAGFAAAKRHLSYFPHSGSVVAALAGELAGYSTSRGTVRFTVAKPLSRELVAALIDARRAELV